MTRIKVKRPEGDHRHRILEVFDKIYEKNNLPENDYKIFVEELMRVPALNFRKYCGPPSKYLAAKAAKEISIITGGVLVPESDSHEEEPRPDVIDLTSEA